MAQSVGSRTAETLGVLGLPAPVVELARGPWDAIVIGAGHNGLACAAYLARAGRRVLVLEARERVGGACTLREVWPGFRVSPCAYLLGLLHPLVIEELGLVDLGLAWMPATAGLFVPFEDGTSVQLWDDDDRCGAEIRRLAPGDLDGFRAFCDVKRRLRDAIRPAVGGDLWVGRAPTREALEARLKGDGDARDLLFQWSMVDYVERFLRDERLQSAYLGQGVIGTNADPRTTLRLLGDAADPSWRARVESLPMAGCTVKLNVALRALPSFRARPRTAEPHHLGQINTPLTKPEWRAGFDAARSDELPRRLWTELYFQSAHDRTVVPDGLHTMSVFAQYVPYTFHDGDWDSRRDEVTSLALASIGRFCDNIPDAVLDVQTLGPPDIEREVGLSGGHIFQGECLPGFMWDQRLSPRTPMPGVFLCGACTHPGGSVIGVNGRNAAMEMIGKK